jgi:hypothetical protein
MGRLFIFREARPKGDVPGGFEREKDKRIRTNFPFTDHRQSNSPG